MRFVWEEIHNDDIFVTERAKVYGGWIVSRVVVGGLSGQEICTLTYVPDDRHLWKIEGLDS